MTTERLQAQYLAQSEAVLEVLDRPVLMVGFDFRIAAANGAFRRLMSAGEPVVGRRCFEVSHGRTTPCSGCGHQCPVLEMRWRDDPVRSVHEHRTAAGRRRFEIESRVLLSDDSRCRIGALLILQPSAESSRPLLPAALVGSAPETVELRNRLTRVAPTDLSVLLIGELGTRKDSVARVIHLMSDRGQGPFEKISCGESDEREAVCEIFGCRKPGPGGRYERREGRIEICRGGTLYFSDAEFLPTEVRQGLRRLLSRGTFRARGDVEWREADVRLIFSTSRRFRPGTGEGVFADDTLLEIAAFPLWLPPLRRRLPDLEEILQRMAITDSTIAPDRLDPECMAVLQRFGFPGNLRQLRAVVERASLLAGEDLVRPRHLPEILETADSESRVEAPAVVPAEEVVSLEEVRDRYLRWAAGAFDGHRSDLAKQLGISERALYRRLERSRRHPE